MCILTLIKIPCHHVLANEIALNFKYRIGLKHFFNINLRIGIIKKLFFCSYFQHISLCFYSNVDLESSLDPTSTNSTYFWWTPLPQKQEIPEKRDDDVIITFFQVFLVFGVAGPSKIMQSGYSLDLKFNFASNELSQSKFE